MFDIFGIEKADARDAIREMMRGATLGLPVARQGERKAIESKAKDQKEISYVG